MENIDLEKYKSAWKEEKSFNKATLTDPEIRTYIMKRSKGLTGSFKAGLVLDIILKIVLGISFIILMVLLRGKIGITGICTGSILILSYLLWSDITTYHKIPGQEGYSGDIQNFLKSRIEFYREKFLKTVYVIALTNPFVFLSGMLYYFYFKYGGIRPLQFVDIIVFSVFCIAGFALGAFIQVKQYNFQVNQLEECLREFEENGINEAMVKRHKKQKRTILIIFIIALVAGLLLLGLLFTQ
jgi:hypothetical protein